MLERGGDKVAGFDLGNSPLDYKPDRVQGKRIFMSTTNGTRALQRVQYAPVLLTAALVNVDAVVKTVIDRQFDSIWIVNSGWQGDYSLEDTVCSGAILHQLQAAGIEITAGNDEAIAAIALYKTWREDLLDLLRQASHGQRLLRLDLHLLRARHRMIAINEDASNSQIYLSLLAVRQPNGR